MVNIYTRIKRFLHATIYAYLRDIKNHNITSYDQLLFHHNPLNNSQHIETYGLKHNTNLVYQIECSLIHVQSSPDQSTPVFLDAASELLDETEVDKGICHVVYKVDIRRPTH